MELSLDELRRIYLTLHNRQRRCGDPNYLTLGFGAKVTGGQIHDTEDLVVRYFVRRKLKRPRPQHRIPPQVRVRLKRGRRVILLTLTTDVQEYKRVVLTGMPVEFSAGAPPKVNNATVGALLRWSVRDDPNDGPDSPDTRWAVLTVAHLFDADGTGGIKRVTIRVTGGGSVEGTLFRRLPQPHDAALLLVDRQDVSRLHGGPLNNQVSPRTLPDLATDKGVPGESLRPLPQARAAFRVETYLPEGLIVGDRRIKPLVHVKSPEQNAFARGTSGSTWTVNAQFAAMQCAGMEMDFYEGYGQPLVTCLEWMREKLSSTARIVAAF